MKKTVLLSLLAVITAFTTGRAEESNLSELSDAVYVQPLSAPAGSQQTLSIRMKNSFAVQTINFDLKLPSELTIVRVNNKLISPSTERIVEFDTFKTSTQPDGSTRLLALAAYENEDGTITNIPVGDGEIATVRVNIDSEAIPGDYPIIVKNIQLVSRENEAKNIEEVTTMLTITEAGDGRILLDENSTTAPESATNVDVRVKRTIKANEWSTIVLPFAMTEEQVKEVFGVDVQLADFTGYDVIEESENIIGITVNFDEVTAIEANHPYIIKVGTAVTEFTVDGVNIEPEDAPCVAFGSEYGRPRKYHPMDFVGTYTADFDFFNDAQSGYAIFLSGGKFWYATASTRHMKAFRAYFDFDDILTSVEEASGAIEFKFNLDDATGIKAISDSLLKGEDTYNLAGQRVGESYKGIVVKKGMKVLK